MEVYKKYQAIQWNGSNKDEIKEIIRLQYQEKDFGIDSYVNESNELLLKLTQLRTKFEPYYLRIIELSSWIVYDSENGFSFYSDKEFNNKYIRKL